jgi:hypothetical protein
MNTVIKNLSLAVKGRVALPLLGVRENRILEYSEATITSTLWCPRFKYVSEFGHRRFQTRFADALELNLCL